MKRSLKMVIASQISAVLSWVILSFIVGFAGVFLTGQIPVLGLGMFLGCLGAITHTILLALDLKPKWWQVGGGFALVLGTISIGLGMAGGDWYPLSFVLSILSFYFLFGALIYVFIQQVVVGFILDV